MALRIKRHLWLAALLALVPVIPGLIGEVRLQREVRIAINNHEDDSSEGSTSNFLLSLLVLPGIIVAGPFSKLFDSLYVNGPAWFWIYCAIAFTSWAVYFIGILLILRWRASQTSPGL